MGRADVYFSTAQLQQEASSDRQERLVGAASAFTIDWSAPGWQRSFEGRPGSPRSGWMRGTGLARRPGTVRVLEVRFYPQSKSKAAFVIFGHVFCGEGPASVERVRGAGHAVEPFEPERLYQQLDAIVTSTIDPFRDLLELRSRFWSFVEVGGPNREPP